MRLLLFISFLLSLGTHCVAQTADSNFHYKYEIRLITGISLNDNAAIENDRLIFNFNNLALYRNFNKNQIGIGFDYEPKHYQLGTQFSYSVHVMANRLGLYKKGYYYGGILAGFTADYTNTENSNRYEPLGGYGTAHDPGYMLGIQAGLVHRIWKCISFNAETAIRYRNIKTGWYFQTSNKELSFPTRVGIRVGF